MTCLLLARLPLSCADAALVSCVQAFRGGGQEAAAGQAAQGAASATPRLVGAGGGRGF